MFTEAEVVELTRAAWSIWEQIGVDAFGSVAGAEDADPRDVVEVAFDANRLNTTYGRPELDELWRTACSIDKQEAVAQIAVGL